MTLSIKVSGTITNASGAKEEISAQIGMTGPAADAITEAAMIKFVRKAIAQGGKPLELKSITVEVIDAEGKKPDEFQEVLTNTLLK